MTEKKNSNWPIRIIAGLAVLVSNVIAGVALALLWVRLFVPPKAMGWDGLADFLGGIMVGTLLGVVVSVVIIALLSIRVQWIWSGIAVVIGGLTFAGLVMTAPQREVSSEPVFKEPFRPAFVVRMKISQSQEILTTVPSDEQPLPFVEAEVWTGKPELIRVGWGPDFKRCVAAPSDDDLATLLPLVEAVIATAGPNCRTPEDDLSLSLRWNLENNPGTQALDAGCLPDQPEFVALTDAIGTLADRLCEAE
ncbi:MAG: hypothetical protein AAF485_06860 [Chloroflexota bacterium]